MTTQNNDDTKTYPGWDRDHTRDRIILAGRADARGSSNPYRRCGVSAMKILMAICAVILLNSCATLQNISTDPLKQAFGDALRSLETASIDQIPALIGKLRAQWLPQGQFYSDFAASQVRAYLAAHPNTPEQAKKVLEALATGLNLRG